MVTQLIIPSFLLQIKYIVKWSCCCNRQWLWRAEWWLWRWRWCEWSMKNQITNVYFKTSAFISMSNRIEESAADLKVYHSALQKNNVGNINTFLLSRIPLHLFYSLSLLPIPPGICYTWWNLPIIITLFDYMVKYGALHSQVLFP